MLRLQVLEGRYGQVRAEGDPKLAAAAQDYLRPLRGGEVIESAPLERAALLLSDLPGVTATPSIRPGPDLGAGDLPVQVQCGDRVNGSVGLDNQDNRYTGQYRANASLAVNSPFLAGDQITVRAQGTSEDLYFGDVGYSLSLGSAGLRGQVGYGDTGYQPGKDFSDLDARGTAQVASAGLRYPLVRSQSRNLTLGVDFQHKKLRDDYRAADVRQNKSSNRVPFRAQFDLRDGLGGGVTYGALNWTVGHLNLGGALAEADSLTARSAGHFSTVNLDIARLQSLAPRWSLYGRFGGQWTRDNLDSSEDFGPGGPAGVRADPVGEGYGDRGWLTQIELRYAAGPVTPFLFYDAGRVQYAARPWQPGENFRRIAGASLGARVAVGSWRAEATAAWRTDGGKPESDSRDRKPLVWVTAQYVFQSCSGGGRRGPAPRRLRRDAAARQSRNRAAAATAVGASAPSSRPPMPTAPFWNAPRSSATPAGFGALAITVSPPPATAPATSMYFDASEMPSMSEPR